MAETPHTDKSSLPAQRRRRVIISCVIYALLCGGALLLAGSVLPALDLDPAPFSRYFPYIALLGFPAILTLAWYHKGSPKETVPTREFVERRVLQNIAPINDQRRRGGEDKPAEAKPRASHRWTLSAETGPLNGLSFGIDQTVVLGRSLDCDIAIVSPNISGQHARLELDEGKQLYIEDLGSAKGVFVNGRRVQRQQLRHQDELRFHDVIFRISEAQP